MRHQRNPSRDQSWSHGTKRKEPGSRAMAPSLRVWDLFTVEGGEVHCSVLKGRVWAWWLSCGLRGWLKV